jgi:hypothetical protein
MSVHPTGGWDQDLQGKYVYVDLQGLEVGETRRTCRVRPMIDCNMKDSAVDIRN